jgi:hypothetical protein
MNDLQQQDADTIHNIIMGSGEAGLIEEYAQALKTKAEMRKGMYAQAGAWYGTPLPENVKAQLTERFGIDTLCKQNLLSLDGAYIELHVLAGALPDKIVDAYFAFDPKQRAEDAGIDFERFKHDLRAAFRGTVGRPGQPDFGILLDASIKDTIDQYAIVLGLGGVRHPYDMSTVDRLSAKDDLDDHFKTSVNQGQQVHDKGIDATSVYLVTPDYSPLAIQVMAQILNFPGSSHYLPTEQKK